MGKGHEWWVTVPGTTLHAVAVVMTGAVGCWLIVCCCVAIWGGVSSISNKGPAGGEWEGGYWWRAQAGATRSIQTRRIA